MINAYCNDHDSIMIDSKLKNRNFQSPRGDASVSVVPLFLHRITEAMNIVKYHTLITLAPISTNTEGGLKQGARDAASVFQFAFTIFKGSRNA